MIKDELGFDEWKSELFSCPIDEDCPDNWFTSVENEFETPCGYNTHKIISKKIESIRSNYVEKAKELGVEGITNGSLSLLKDDYCHEIHSLITEVSSPLTTTALEELGYEHSSYFCGSQTFRKGNKIVVKNFPGTLGSLQVDVSQIPFVLMIESTFTEVYSKRDLEKAFDKAKIVSRVCYSMNDFYKLENSF